MQPIHLVYLISTEMWPNGSLIVVYLPTVEPRLTEVRWLRVLVVKTIHIEEVLGIQVRSSPAQPTAMPRVVEIMIEA